MSDSAIVETSDLTHTVQDTISGGEKRTDEGSDKIQNFDIFNPSTPNNTKSQKPKTLLPW